MLIQNDSPCWWERPTRSTEESFRSNALIFFWQVHDDHSMIPSARGVKQTPAHHTTAKSKLAPKRLAVVVTDQWELTSISDRERRRRRRRRRQKHSCRMKRRRLIGTPCTGQCLAIQIYLGPRRDLRCRRRRRLSCFAGTGDRRRRCSILVLAAGGAHLREDGQQARH